MSEASIPQEDQEVQELAPLTVRVPREVLDGIKRVAAREDRSMTAEIRRTLRDRIAASDAEALEEEAA